MLQAQDAGQYPLTNSERARGIGRGDEDDPLRNLPGWGDEEPASRMRPFHLRALARAQECDAAERAAWESRGRPVAFTTADGVQVEAAEGIDGAAGEAEGPAAASGPTEAAPEPADGKPDAGSSRSDSSDSDMLTTGDWDGCTTSTESANMTTADGERIVSRVRVRDEDSNSNPALPGQWGPGPMPVSLR